MSILTKAIDESRKRTQRQNEDTSAVSASPLTRAIDQARQRQAGGEAASPSTPAGTAALPQAGRAALRGGMPEWLSNPSFAPIPGTRSSRAVREEMDGVDRAMGALREKRDGLNAQAQALDSRTLGMKRRAGAYANVVGHGAAAQSAQLREQAQELGQELERLEQGRTELQAEWDRADAREFDQLRQTPEFRAAVDKAMAPTSGIPEVTSTYSKYIDLSRAMSYLQAKARGDEQWAAAAHQNADMALDRMDEGQRDRLAYYVGIGDYDSAMDYLDRIMPGLNQEAEEQVEQGLTAWAQEHPALGAATNMVSWPLNIPAYFANAEQAAKNAVSGQDERDRHLNAYVGPKIGSGTAQGTQEAARSAATQFFNSEAAGDAAAFLAGTGLSIGQNASQIALLGPGSLPAMAMSAAGGSTVDALDRGATPGQAFTAGAAAGAIETLTEKIPLDNLFRLAKEGGGKGVKAVVKEVLQQMGTEATEEAVSEIANNIVDAAVMGEKSELWSYVQELRAAGVPKKEAERQAFLKFYLLNTAASAAGGAVSGGVMGGGALAMNQLGARKGQGRDAAAETMGTPDKGPLSGAYAPMTEQGTITPAREDSALRGPQETAEREQRSDVAAQIAYVERNLRASYERGDINEAGYQSALARVREAQADIAGSQQALEAAQAAAQQDAQDARKVTEHVDSEGQRLQEIAAEAQRLRQDYAQGKISDGAFDRAMDGLQAEAELTGMEASEAQKLLDSGPSYMTEGRMNDGAGTAAGEQLPGRDGGRLSGAGAGGENGGLAGGGPQSPADAGGGAGYRDDFRQSLRTEAVSSKELGLAGGTDAQTVRILPEDSWDGELRTIARKVRRETGLSVRFTLGPMETVRSDGQVQRVRGAYNENGIFVQVDNRTATAEQIADHETFHSYAQSDPGLIQAAEEAVTERYGREELQNILAAYAKNLRGVADVSELDTMDAQALADIKNEMLADAFAGINAFGSQAAKYQETVYEVLEGREAVQSPQGRENAQAMDQRTGPPDTYSIEYDRDNRPFVTVEEDILAGVPREDWVRTVKDNLRKKFPNGVTVGNNEIKINSQSRREMTFSEYSQWLSRHDENTYANKFRAAAHADEIIKASRDYVSEGLKHSRKDNIKDFARGTVQLRIGVNDYAAEVVVGTTSSGEMLLYDVVNLRPIQINERNGHTVQPNQTESYRSGTPVSEKSIAQTGAAVKGDGLFFPTAEQGTVTLPRGEDTIGQTRFSTDEDGPVSNSGTFEDGIMLPKGDEVLDGTTLPTLAEAQARRAQAAQAAQENAGDVPDSGAGRQTPGRDVVEALPAKARNYLQKAEGRLMNKIGELLSVPKSAQREFLQDIVRDISTEYLSTGQVSQEARDRLFEQAYEKGVQVDREYYDNYKHVRDYLRTTPITVSEWLKGDIDDYNEWRKGAFGTLRLVKKGGNGPDTAYMELQHMAPELFPDNITHPADQLRHILEIAKGIRVSEQSLEEAYGPEAEEFKRWSRQDFDEAVADGLREIRQVKRYADERAQAKEPPQVPTTPQEAAELYRRKKGAQRLYQRAQSRNLLTEHDQVQVGRLLRGELELSHLDPAEDNVQGITAVYEAKLEYEQLAGQIQAWNKQRKAQLMEQADGFLETANQWKDKKAGILYSRETMERNIRDIVPDRALADRINKAYFQPVHQAAAEANKTKNHYRDRVRALELSRKAAKGDAVSEAYAVQLLGEAEDNIRRLEESHGRKKEQDGKTLQEWQAAIGELWENSPSLDQNKIRGAVKEFRAIYDELFQQMNEARVRNGYEPVSYRQGYFPHFQADSEGLMAQFGRALGIDMAVTNLPTTINGLTHTFKPGIQWFGNALERKGFETAYDAVQGFDRYIEGAADVIHQTDNIQALRTLAAQARYRTGDEGLRQQVDRVRANEQLTEQEKQALIDEINKEGKFALSNFVVELDEYTNMLANKKSRADRNMEQALGRRMYNIVKGLEGRVAANMVAVNPASWLTNFVPLTQGWGAVKSRFMLEGMWDTLKAYKADDGMVGMSSFLTNRRGSDPIVKTWQQNASAVLSQPMEYIDQFTADSLVRARFKQNQAAGLSEAASIEEADAWAAGVMADRSKGSTPTLFNRSNPLTKVFTQFQLEVNNQLSYLFKDLPSDAGKKGVAALVAALFKFFVGAYLYNEVYEYFIGRRCALDPIGILNDTVGDFTGYQLPNLVELGVGTVTGDMPSFETEKKNPYEAATGLAGNVAEELPFIGGVLGGGRVPISSALPDWENLGKAALNDQWSGEKRLAAAAKALSGPATYLTLPFGGGQVKKIYQGLKAVHEGGSYTVDNEGRDILQYPVFNETMEDRLLTLPTALTFGKSSLPTAREWAEHGFKSMTAKQTACYQGMTELGVPQRDAYQLLQELGNVEAPTGEDVAATERAAYQKRKLLQEAGISAQGKGVVYYTLLASDKGRELMDNLAEGEADMGEAARVLMELKDTGAELKGAEASAAKKGIIAGSSLSEEERNEVFRYVLGKESKGAALSDSLEGAGLDPRSAAAVANAVNALTPQEGRKTVSDAQKWRAVVDAVKDTNAQKAALLTVMEDSARMRYEIASSYGIKPEAWVQVKEALPQFDADNNGSFSNSEVKSAIDALSGNGALLAPWNKEPIRLSREEKAVLWQLFTGGKSGSGNPYSVRVGKKVAEELERSREKK